MTHENIQKLNDLNKDFYDQIGEYFDSSRQYAWEGWDKLWDFLIENNIPVKTILDLACGNGRFYKYLQDKITSLCHTGHDIHKNSILENNFAYTGLDNNEHLLTQAVFTAMIGRDAINHVSTTEFFMADLSQEIDFESKYDLIVSFGFVHHIAGFENRVKFFKQIKSLLNEDGIACISLWRFLDDEKQKSKIVDEFVEPYSGKALLEDNDYILSWNRGKKANRYCHYVSDEEQKKLLELSGLNLVKEYKADNSNRYLIIS